MTNHRLLANTICGPRRAIALALATLFTLLPAAAVRADSDRPPPGVDVNVTRTLPKTDEPSVTGMGIFFEEDKFLDIPVVRSIATNMDRNYTGGGSISSSGGWIHDTYVDVPLRALDYVLYLPRLLHDTDHSDLHGLLIGVTAFTPGDVASPDVVPGDRPYGSLTFVSWLHRSVNHAETRSISSELTLGALGLGIGDWVQTAIHRAAGFQTPQGWSHQISNGGEPTARYALGVQYRPAALDGLFWDVTGGAKGEVGYYTAASVAVTARLGCLGSQPWQFADTPMRGENEAAPACPWKVASTRAEAFVWGTARGRAVLYNALLEGQFGHSDYTLSSSEINHLIGEYEVGMTVSIAHVRLTWEPLVARTAEFSGPLARTHTWGTLYAGYDGIIP